MQLSTNVNRLVTQPPFLGGWSHAQLVIEKFQYNVLVPQDFVLLDRGDRSGVPRQVLRVLEHPHHKKSSRSIGIITVLLRLLASYVSTCTRTNLAFTFF